MKASIIIASNLRRKIVQRAIPSALTQDFAPAQFEVIVVLDGCDEPAWCQAERRNARCLFRVIPQPKRGQAAAINTGLRAASGELALFLDDDILCPPDLLSKHVNAHLTNPGHLVFGPIFTSEESSPGLAADWIRELKDEWFQQLTPETPTDGGWCFCFANPNTSARRALLLQAGGLDESFWRHNDTEFGFRLWSQGLRFVYLPGAAVSHVVDASIGDLVRQHAYEEGRGEVRLCRKHAPYRQFTRLGAVTDGGMFRRIRRRTLLSACWLVDLVLAPLSHLLTFFRGVPSVRRIGLRVISIRYLAQFFRGAIAECGSATEFRRDFARQLPVLAYHRVGRRQPGEWYALTISPERFESHLRWLKHDGWTTITSAQWLGWLERGDPLPEKPILLTFDDGFADNVTNAFPLLQRYGFVALTAVVTNQLGATNQWDVRDGLPEFQLMAADDVRHWAKAGMEFVSHSRSHPHLSALAHEELAAELSASRAEVAELTGSETNSFVYPYGDCDDRVCTEAARHYELAFSLSGGLNGLSQPRFCLRRIVISERAGALHLWCYTRLGGNPLGALRRLFRGRTAYS